jgi:hypothetical protein
MYTITEHSGLGPAATEVTSLSGMKDRRAVEAVGGIVIEGYSAASAYADALIRYRDGAIVPSGVSGTFAALRCSGLRVCVPDLWGQTLARVGAADGWSTPVEQLGAAVAGILAAAVDGGT